MGLACAKRLAEDSAAVVIVDRDKAAALTAASALPHNGRQHLGLGADVTLPESAAALIEAAAHEVGTPTILINAAGVLYPTPFLNISLDEWNRVVGVSLNGSFLFSQACLPRNGAKWMGKNRELLINRREDGFDTGGRALHCS